MGLISLDKTTFPVHSENGSNFFSKSVILPKNANAQLNYITQILLFTLLGITLCLV